MYLKSLELQGFKSFPDKIKLTFDKGLTAVVGPNGSGKSNIGDSVRWVLGEQSTKTLRGNKMEDVIFSGTVARKPVGFAAVTLTIDNQSGRLAGMDAEVSVTRRLYRSGESEYQINGKNVRLKDVNELFMDTGLGRDGYSIIGQGRIAEIVGAKSNERRDIFEEAAGISKFRYKKQEAQRRLDAAQDNLLRLNDIVQELEGRVEPLRIQAGKAEKFLALAEERKRLEISLWVKRLDEYRAKLETLSEQALVAHAQYENTERDMEREEQRIADGYTAMQECTVSMEQEQSRILELERASAEVKSEIAVCENDIAHSEAALATLEERRVQEQSSESETLAQIDEQEQTVEALCAESERLRVALSQAQTEFSALEQEAALVSEQFAAAGNEINALYRKQSEYRVTVTSAKQNTEELAERLLQADRSFQEQTAAVAQYKEQAQALRGKIEAAQESEQEHSNRLNGFQRLYQGKLAKLEESRKALEAAVLSLREKQQRQRILQDLENNMEGFGRSVKEILKAGKTGRISGIHGSVAQLIRVESAYGVAIETALGAAMQNIIVENEDIAKRCIRHLKEQRAGRATFLPLTSVRGQLLQEPRLAQEEGFVAIASELVGCDAVYTPVLRSLLGRIAIAEDIDAAALIAKKYGYKFRIVTLDGQVINAGGSFTGGSAAHSSGVITRKNELETLAKELETLRAAQTEQQSHAQRLKAETDKLALEIEAARDALGAASALRIQYTAEETGLCNMARSAEEQLAARDDQLAALQKKREEQEQTYQSAQEALSQTEAQIAAAEEQLSAKQGMRDSMRERREALSAKHADLKLRQVACQKDEEAAQAALMALRESTQQIKERAAQLIREREEQEALIAQKREQITKKQESLAKRGEDAEACREKITELQKLHNDRQQFVTQLREGMRALTDAKEKYAGEATRVDERKIAVQKDYDGIILQMLESYELTRTEAEALAEPLEDVSAAQRHLQELKGKIRGLGNVNVGAIDEYREVSERYTFLSGQVADVTAAKRDLEKLIASLTEDMCRIFAESFVKINRNFQEIFVELFGGGKAELILTDPENVLESGIEISVAPPGKVIKNLISLSGGEQSFVAICIYFAILKLRPAPFCILDEIDAALDEVNVRKYAQYLKHFTDQTQFVLVTHRRSAMEEANVLYGVTMQEDGISRLLKMEQADIADEFDT